MKNTTKFCQIYLFFPKKITIFFDKFSDIFPKSIYFCLKMVEKMKVIRNLSFPHEKHNKILSNLLFFPKKITIFFDKFSDIFPKSIYFCLKMVKKMKVIMNLSFPHEKQQNFVKFPFFSPENGYFSGEKKGNLTKFCCFSCGNDKFIITFIYF